MAPEEDIHNSNIDVFVELEDSRSYTTYIATPNNHYWIMENDGMDYFCGCPFVIVKSLAHDNIERALTAYSKDDAYWLKYYYSIGVTKINELNKIVKRSFNSPILKENVKIKNIIYPVPLSEIEDIKIGNIDVFVQMQDGLTYVIDVATPSYYYKHMETQRLDYYCGRPAILVKGLTHDNIERALTDCTEFDAYILKCYHMAGIIEIGELDKVLDESFRENEEFFDGFE